MAITAATLTGDFSGFIRPEIAAPIFDEAVRQSAVMTLAQRVDLPASGKAIPIVTGKPTVGWVGEGAKKPSSKGSMALRTVEPKKAACIVVVSAEVVRANPGGYVTSLQGQLAEAFGTAFDIAALHGKAHDGVAAGPFATYVGKTTKTVELGSTTTANGGLHGDFAAALKLLLAAKKRCSGWVLDESVESMLLGAVDSTGKPLFVDLPSGADNPFSAGRILRRPALLAQGISLDTTRGFGGNWGKCAWGVVGGISYDISKEATVTINGELVSLFENNLLAIRAEAEYGFVTDDDTSTSFVKLVDAV